MTRRILCWLRIGPPPDASQLVELSRSMLRYALLAGREDTQQLRCAVAYVSLMLYRDGWRR